MDIHQVEIMAREVSLFYKPFISEEEIFDLLEKIDSLGYEVQEYCDLEATYGISFSNIYYISVSKNGQEIDKFDPTRRETRENLDIKFTEINNFGVENNLVGYLYMSSYLKSLFRAEIETDEYSRDKFSIENTVYHCKHDIGDEDYDKHVFANISYGDEDIYFEPESTDGSYEITFVVKVDGEFEEIDVYGEMSDIIEELEEYSITKK